MGFRDLTGKHITDRSQLSFDLVRIMCPKIITNPQLTATEKGLGFNRYKIAGSIPNEANELFSIYIILPAALGPEVYSATNINEYQKRKNNNVSGE
jgi:hypothetical protein